MYHGSVTSPHGAPVYGETCTSMDRAPVPAVLDSGKTDERPARKTDMKG